MPTCSRGLSETHRAHTKQRIADGQLPARGPAPDAASRLRASANRRVPLWRSLAVNHPQLVLELHPTRNGKLDPNAIGAGSRRKLWWRCSQGHEWDAVVADRSGGHGCPRCANVLQGPRLRELNQQVERRRTLAVRYPALFRQLHPARNETVDLRSLAAGSARRVWWRCPSGHEWQARVVDRSAGTGCPTCAADRRVATLRGRPTKVPPERSLAAKRPELLPELHPKLNVNLDPHAIAAGSARKAWWRCRLGHEWQARINDRSRGAGCPVCARSTVRWRERSLAVKHPHLLAELHPTQNSGSVDPFAVAAGSNRKLWWRCDAGHEWEATVAARGRGTGCPVCARRHVPAARSLARRRPLLIAELHPNRNGGLDPASIAAFSNRKLWWRCADGHEWESVVASRSAGAGCPRCAEQRRRDNPPT